MRNINNATSWLLSIFDSELPGPAKLVAAYLRTHMNDHQEIAFPSVARIAHMTSQSERTVQRHLATLCDTKWLSNQGIHPKYGTNQYLITNPGVSESHPPVTESSPRHSVQIPPSQSHPNKPSSKPREYIGFRPPDVNQVREYCQEKGYSVDPETFVDWNTSKGWMIGKNKMKDWKAAVRTWNRREASNGQSRSSGKSNSRVKVTKLSGIINTGNDIIGRPEP